MFQKFWLVLILITTLFASIVSTGVQAKAFGANYTDSIKIDIKTESSKYIINYNVIQTFRESSRGIFLALPKNQDGIWTEYKVNSVQRSSLLNPTQKNRSNILDNPQLNNEKYEEIKEWGQLRVRVGDKDKSLALGQYNYQIQLEATRNQDYAYNLTLLYDWLDPVISISASLDGKNVCTNNSCTAASTNTLLNSGKPNAPIYFKIWNSVWIYVFVTISISILGYAAWYSLARDPSDGFVTDKPEFEPPQGIYPWQAQFLINEGSISFKETFLAYLLWLNNNQYIRIIPNSESEAKDKITITILKDLPEGILPIFNPVITQMPVNGLSAAILDSKINAVDGPKIEKSVYQSLKSYYAQKPAGTALSLIFTFLLFGTVIGLGILKEATLAGDSWIPVALYGLIFAVPWAIWITKMWAKLTKDGYAVRAYCERYKLYLEKAEQLKLDFSNNPDEGVQFYLKAVPFAASFMILPQFQKYFTSIIPSTSELDTANTLRTSFYAAAFYSPPSSSDGGFSGGGGGGFSGGGGSW